MANIAMAPKPMGGDFWQRLTNRRNKYYFIAFLFVLPAVVNFLVFRYLPILAALQASLWQYSLLGGYGDFNGIQHYVNMLNDPIFWKSLRVTAVFVLLKVPIQVVLSLVLAVFLQRETWATGFVRSAVFTPVVTSVVVVSIVWSMMYHSQLGLINSMLSIIGIPRQSFLSDPSRALPAITLTMIWKELGFSMIIIMAGLKGIPTEYREAAIVDGAKAWQIFVHITLPLLKRVIMFVVVTQTVFSFQVFVPILVMTSPPGGPLDSTKAIVYYIYQFGFLFQDMGYASALSIVTLVILLAVSVVQMRVLRSDVEY